MGTREIIVSQTEVVSESRPAAKTPRWVKVLGAVIIGLLLLYGVLHLTGNSPMSSLHGMGHPNLHNRQCKECSCHDYDTAYS